MGNAAINFIKKHHSIYTCYYWVMSAFVNVLKLFAKPDDKLILFVVYGGKFYSDSPKCIYESMLKDDRYKDYRLVWAFRNPKDFPHVADKIKIDTIKYYLTALKARCWITNESVTRALKFKGKNTFYFCTTHTPLPKLGAKDDVKGKPVFTSISRIKYDCTCAQSEAEKKIQLHRFELEDGQVHVVGYPKNDIIANHQQADVDRIREKLHIRDDRKLILYAPTFREMGQTSIPFDLRKWEESLKDKYILLFRAHHTVASQMDFSDYKDFVIDVSTYPDNTELLIVSDILISDYSGIFFEFGVQEKPMYCFAYDYDDYIKYRGLSVDVPKELPGGKMNEREFLDYFVSTDKQSVMKAVNVFRSKYITEYGHATSKCLDIIHAHIAKAQS